MKNVNQHPDKLTLHDIMDAINAMASGFTGLQQQLQQLEQYIGNQVSRLDRRIDEFRFEIKSDIRDIQLHLGRMELRHEDVADTVLNHEERLVELERPQKLGAVT